MLTRDGRALAFQQRMPMGQGRLARQAYLGYTFICMSKSIHSNACAEVQILPVLGIPDVCTFAVRQYKRRASVHGQKVSVGFVKQSLHIFGNRRGIFGVGDCSVAGARSIRERLRAGQCQSVL